MANSGRTFIVPTHVPSYMASKPIHKAQQRSQIINHNQSERREDLETKEIQLTKGIKPTKFTFFTCKLSPEETFTQLSAIGIISVINLDMRRRQGDPLRGVRITNLLIQTIVSRKAHQVEGVCNQWIGKTICRLLKAVSLCQLTCLLTTQTITITM